MNNKIREGEKYLKRVLKGKMSVTEGLSVSFMIAGFFGLSSDSEAAWTTQPLKIDGANNSRISIWDADSRTGDGSVILTRSDRINKELVNSVVIGTGGNVPGQSGTLQTQKLAIDIEGYDSSNNGFNSGIVAIGSVRVQSNPHGVGRTGTGGQAVAIGNDVTSTSQAVAIGNNTYALGGSSIAIGNDDIETYRDKVTNYDYNTYLRPLYDKIDPGRAAYGIGDAGNAIYSPNVAGGEGSISIGSRSVAYKPGSTALGTLAYALGKGATALGTQSRAEGEGSIAIGNQTRNFANQALAIGNDSQILKIGGTAVGLRARAGGEGSIAIGTDVYANTKMNNTSSTQNMTKIHDTLKAREMGVDSSTIQALENELVKNDAVSPDVRSYHDVSNIVKENGKNALVIGTKSAAVGSNSMALGRGAFAMADNSFGIGSYSYADKANSLAIGTSSRSLAEDAIVMGAGSVATAVAKNSTVIGTRSGVGGENSSVVGSKSEAFSKNTIIFGNLTKVGELGSSNETDNNIAIGNAISIGSGVTNSMAYGPDTRIGNTNRADNSKIDNSTAFGRGATIERLYNGPTTAQMSNAQAKEKADANPQFMYTGNNAMAIGNYSRAVLENSVALGVRSDTDYTYADLMQPGWTARGSVAVPTSGQTGVISVGSKGQERRIVNVASGFRDTDAVNVIQLRTLEETVTNKVEGIESGMHYLSVNKKGTNIGSEIGSAKVTELIERRKNYDQYIRYKTQQLQLKARQAWQGEKFNEASLTEINNKVAELEADPVIAREAAALKNYTVTATVPSGKDAAQAYKDLVNALEVINANLKSDAKYRALADGNDIEALKLETNYSNEGGKGVDSLAIGFRASAGKDATEALAVGYKSTANGVEAVALGSQSAASGQRAVALGADTVASGKDAIAIGGKGDTVTTASGISAIAIGNGAKINSNYSVGLGGNVQVAGDTSVAIGDRAKTKSGKAVSVGPLARALGSESVAIGNNAITGYLTERENDSNRHNLDKYNAVNYSTAIGGTAKVHSNYSVAIGNGATVGELQTAANGTVSLKNDASASVVLGSGSKSYAAGGTVAGADSEVTGKQSSILGRQSKASADNTTVLGANSTANLANSVALGQGVTVSKSDGAGYLTNQAFADSGKVVSVGLRRINQLADGAKDDDAVTVAQLKKAAPKVEAEVGNKITTNPGATLRVQSGDFDNSNRTVRYLGENLSTHIGGTADAPIVTVGLRKDPKFETLKLNNGVANSKDLGLSVDNDGNLNLATSNTGNTKAKITNLADGTADSDAVTVGQLKGATPTLVGQVTTAGNNTWPKIAPNARITITGGSFNTDNNNAEKFYSGDNLMTHISGNNDAPEIKIGIKKIPTFRSIKLNNENGGAQTLSLTADDSGNLSVGSKKITNVADGAINATSKDAINGSQLNTVKTTAEAAQTTANTAKGIADTAKGTADAAKTKAEEVDGKINSLGNKQLTFAANSGNVTRKLGETIGIKGDNSTISTSAANNEITIKVKDGGIGTNQLANGAVTEAKLADNAVTTGKIKDGAVTAEKLVNDLNTKINNANAVASNKIRLTGDKESATAATVTKTDDVLLNKENGIEFAINGKSGEIVTKASGNKVEIGLNPTLKSKLDNLADNADTKYATKTELDAKANKNADNIDAEKWKQKLGLTTAVLGTVSLGLEAANIQGTTTTESGSGTLDLTAGDKLKVTGTDGVEVKLNNKEFTVGLDQNTKDALKKIGKSVSDGRDGKEGKDGANGTNGLTAADGLNGKDLTDKVNALRNGEAGTVVFTDSEGNRLVKANDGKYYKPEFVAENGDVKPGVDSSKGIENPELRVVSVKGDTKTPNTLNNLASGLGLDGKKPGTNPEADYDKPITVEDAQTVVKGLATQREGLNKAATVRDLQALTNAGLTFEANTVGDTKISKVDRKLGETLKITGDGIKVSKNATNDGFVFSLSKGKVETVNVKDKAVTSAKLAEDARTVVYITPDNKVVELGADGKLHKAEDLQGKTYVVVKTPAGTIDETKTGYYADDAVNADGELKNPETAQKLDTPAVVDPAQTTLRHALNGYTAGGTDITTKSVLTNVGAGTISDKSTDAINGSQLKDVADKVGLTVGSDNKTLTLPALTGLKDSKGNVGAAPQSIVTGLNAVTDKVNEGIKYKGDLGNEGTQQLGTVFNVNRAGTDVELKDGTKQTISKIVPVPAGSAEGTLPTIGTEEIDRKYVGKNIITQYTKDATTGNGKLEIGFAESPEFKNVKADNVTTGSIVFDDGSGKKLSLGPTSDGKLQVGGKEISTELVLSKDGTTAAGKVDLAKQKLHVEGKNEVEVEISGQKVTVGLSEATKQKLDNLDANANDKYAKKDASNLANLSDTDKQAWRNAIGLGNAVSGTGKLSIAAATKGTAENAQEEAKGKATVSLNGTEEFNLLGTDGITVSGSNAADNKTLTFGLDQATKDAIKNIGKSTSDGRDGLDGKDGHNGSHGLTAADGLNGKDLTDKVNALRNGEAGTVVFTDSEGNRLVKANDGKYYKPEFVAENGDVKPGVDSSKGIENPELRVVSVKGDTKTPNTLNNLASGLGLDGKKPGTNPEADYDKPITVEDAQTVVKGLATQREGLNKAATVRDLQALTNAGLTFEANTVGDTKISKVDRKLGETLKITGDGIKVSKNATNDGFVFSLSKGKVETVNVKDKAVTSAKLAEDARTVVYITPDNKVVELGADGKLHKAEDLQGKTYVVVKTPAGTIDETKTGYYADDAVNADGELKNPETAQKLDTPAVVDPAQTTLRHALNGYTAGGTDITTKSVLTNVGAGTISDKSTDAINGSQLKDVADKVGLTVGSDNKTLTLPALTGLKDSKGNVGAAPQSIVTGLNAVTDKVNEGIKYKGDLGNEGTQQLGTVFNVNRAGTDVELKDGTKQTISKIVPVPAGSAEGTLPTIGTEEIDRKYVGKNIITQYTKDATTGNGKLEIGFAESPEFKNVKADNVTTGSIVFDDGSGKKLSLGPTSDGKLQVGGKEISTELVLSKDGTTAAGKVDLAKQKLHVEGKNEVEVEISGQKVTVGLSEATKQKLDNLDANANDKYAKKDASNLANLSDTDKQAWRNAIGLGNAVSGTGKLSIAAATKGTAENAQEEAKGKATVSLNGTEEFNLLGTDGITVSGSNAADNKTLTFGLDQATKDAIKNIGKSTSDGRDGLDGKDGHNGSHGLTAADGLNGKDLTDKVNALRNGEAGTVVFTDSEGNRLVKANDGKYYKPEFVAENGDVKPGVDSSKGIENPELRVVSVKGDTKTPNTLNNLASGLGLDGKKPGTNPEADYDKPITVEDAQTVVKGLATQREGLNKAATVRDLQALTNAGLTFEANTVGDTKISKVDRKLGETLKITGDGIKVSKNATNDGFVFSLSKGKVETVNVKDKAVTSAKLAEDARTVVYITPDNKVVELGADGKLHKAEDLQGKTYVVVKTPAGTIDETKTGYYADDAVNADGELKNPETAQKLDTPAVVDPAQTTLRHALNGYTAGGTDITTKSVLTNVGAGTISDKSTDAINGSQLKDVADKVGLTVGSDNKTLTLPALTGLKDSKGNVGAAPQSIVTGLNAVTDKVNEGIKYKGDLGNEGTQQLGTVFNVNRAGTDVELKDGTKQTISKIVPVPAGSAEGTLPTIGTEEIDRKYVGKNIITQYTKDATTGNGKLEIGFAESPEFKNVKADNVTTGSIVFDDGSGKKLSLGPTSDGKLQVGGKEISTELVLSKDGTTAAGKVDLAKQKLHVEGKNEVEVEISGQKVTVGLSEATKQKLDNLDANANDKYAKKDASNLANLSDTDKQAWRNAIGLGNAVSGTGKLSIAAATKGTAENAQEEAKGKATVKLDGNENFKLVGTDGITVSGSDEATNKTLTFGLDQATKDAIKNIGKSTSDGRDGKDGRDGANGTNGSHGLTAADGLNGKDLTDKVNALRNGEAGTVVFTDAEGNRLVKANDGKYYPVADVEANGNVKQGVDPSKGIENPELRVVSVKGDTKTPNKLSNIANGKIDENSKDAINGSQIKDVLNKLGVETDKNGTPIAPTITALNKADGTANTAPKTLKDGLNDVIAKVNEGIQYNGDLGTKGTQQLGTVFNVVRAGRTTETGETPLTETVTGTTPTTINYVGDNLITKYSKNNDGSGKLEIGFKESPTFKDVTADKVTAKGDITAGGTITGKDGKFETVKVTEKITTKEIEFKDGTGNNLTLVSGKDGNLYINGVAVPSAANAPVIYTNTDGERVELGQDGKVYKPSDLTGFTYVKGVTGFTDGYYADNQFKTDASGAFIKDNEGNKVLKVGEQPTTLLTGKDYKGEVLHKLSPLSKTDNNPRRLVNVAAGKDNTDAVNVGQLNALKTNKIKLTADGVTPADGGAKTNTETNALTLDNNGGISFGIKGTNGIETSATGTDVTVKLSDTYKTKLDNLDSNAKDTYAKKDATNITAAEADKWKKALGLEKAVSGTGKLSIAAATKGTAENAQEEAKGKATVSLNGTEEFNLLGTDGITVSGSNAADNKTLTFGLDQATKDAIKNIGKSTSDGRDGLDGKDGHNGSHGLTAADGLNGKDLTDKVNALRNGEAGTVVFTDAAGNRLVKANDGKYYPANQVKENGELKDPATATATENPELRTVNADGTTTKPVTLNNVASALGLDGKKPGATPGAATEDYGKPISKEDAKAVINDLVTKADGLNKVATARDLQAVAQAGLDFTGNVGTTHRALGTTLNIVGKDQGTDFNETKFNETYTTDNVATNVKADGTVEIGFKKSPTFDDVKAKNIEALNGKFENLKVNVIEFKTATGDKVTIATGKDGNLYINGVAVPTAESAPVIYTDTNGNRVEKGQDGKIYKPKDLEHLTYVSVPAKGTEGEADYQPDKSGYYTDAAFETEEVDGKQVFKHDKDGNKILKANAVAEDLSGKAYTGEVVHNLSPIDKANPKTDGYRLVNVAAGTNDTDAVNVKQLNAVKDTPIKFKGDTDNDVVERKLGDTLNITGDGVKVTKNATGDGLVLSIDKGKVQTKNVADQAVTSAKLAQDARTVVYTTQDNKPVELGADGKLYKSEDLKDKTYIEVKTAQGAKDEAKSGYYKNSDLNPEKTAPLEGKTPATLTAVNTNPNNGGEKLKHALNGYIPGGTDVTTNSVLTNVGDGEVSATSKDAINGSQFHALKTNTIKLTADGVTPENGGDKTNVATKALGLDNNGGLSFGIKGTANEIETTASETGTDVTLKLSKEVTDKLANITAAADGKDGKIGATGNTGATGDQGATGAMGEKGLTGQDGLNGKDLTTKANALRDGEAGTVVFTDKDGNRLVKANDGKYYKTNEVNPDGSLIGTPTAVDTPELRTVNSDGTTTKPVTLNNVASALGLDGKKADGQPYAKPITEDDAKKVVTALVGKGTDLNKVATARDLQAVAQAGLDFTGNAGTVHRALGTTLKIVGKDQGNDFNETKFNETYTTDNVATNVKEDGTIQIGISKKVKFEEVDGDKVKAGEVVLKPTGEGKDKDEVKLTTDGKGNLVVGGKTITAGPIKLALGGKTVAADKTETKSGGTDADKVDLSAGETLNVIGEDGVTVNVKGKDITLGLDKATTDKLKNITAVSDGKDGKDAKDGTNGANGTHGLTAKDGLNGKDLTTKVNALRNGEAGTVVFTDKDGNRLVKANDGKYYKTNEVNPDGSLIGTPTAVDTLELRTVNSDGTTTKPVTLNNVASALGLDSTTAEKITAENAKTKVGNLLDETNKNNLNKVATARDLQAVAQAGLDFKGNSGEVHRALGTALNVVGQGTPAADFAGASGNINVVASETTDQATNEKITKLEIQLSKALKEIESIQNDKTKITLDENDGVKVDGKDGGKVVVNGKDGNSTVAINGGDGTNGSSVTVNGKDGTDGKDGVTIKGSDGTNGSSVAVNGKDGKDGVTIKGTDGTNGSSIVVNGKDGKPGVTINGGNGTDGKDGSISFAKDGQNGTGSITGLKDPDKTDKTAAATVNYVNNEINNVTNNINNAIATMDKGLNFAGNDNQKVNAKLDGTVTIKGEGTVAGATAANNIKVEKDTAENSKGLVVKLADKLTGMTGFETKEENGKKVTIDKNGISLTTTGTPGANLKLGTDGTITGVVAKPDDDTSVATVGYIKDKIKTSAGLTLKGDTTNVVNNNTTTNNVQNLGSTLEVKAATETITAAVKEEKDGKIVAKAGETTTYTGKNLTTTYTLDGTTGTGTISVAMSERPEFEKVTLGTGDKKMILDGTAGSIEFAKSNPTKEVYADNNGNIIKYKDENGEIKVIERNVGTGSISGLKDVETVTVDGEKIAIDRTQAATAGYVDEKVADVKNEVRNIVNQVDKNAQRIEEVNKQAKEGIAAVAAMATLDFNDAPVGRVGVGAAIGGYRGTQAVAVGAVYGINESFKVNAKLGVPTSRPNGATYGVSATYYFDR